MNLEVLVVTMNQKDTFLAEKMNLSCDVVIANQCGRWDYTEKNVDNRTVRMISSDTIGVGLNRNLAMQIAKADILLFADDDATYYDDTPESVVDAFRKLPDADVILFGLDYTRNGEIYERRRCKTERAYLWNSMKYGACRMAVRRSSIQSKNIWFTTLFGGGCIYGCGEDSIFLRNCFRSGLKVYTYSHVLGTCAKDQSSWFTGFNEKYFFDKGAMLACAFPKIKHLIKWYYIVKFSRKTDLPFSTVIKETNKGIKAFQNLESFEKSRKKEVGL